MTNEPKESSTAISTKTESENWELLQRQVKAFIASGFLPDHVTKGASPGVAIARAVTIAMKGRELGIPPLQAFSSISIISGKPCLSAELMLALVYQRVKGAKVTFRTPPDKQNQECTVEMQRPGGEVQAFRFTMHDAQTAGVVRPNSPWQKFPAAMLRARAISAGARAVFPDAVMGCYTPEEMGGDVLDHPEIPEVTPAPRLEAPVKRAAQYQEPLDPNDKVVSIDSGPAPWEGPAPKQADFTRANPNWQTEPATEKQIARLYAVGKNHGYNHEDLKAAVWDICQVEHLQDLSKAQVQVLFAEFEGKEDKK